MTKPVIVRYQRPIGTSIEWVSVDDPKLSRVPIVIEGSSKEMDTIWRKFFDYRTWDALSDINTDPKSMQSQGGFSIPDAVRNLFNFNEFDPDYTNNVESVSVFYPKNMHQQIVQQMSRLPLAAGGTTRSGARSISVNTPSGAKVLPVLLQEFDIEVPNAVHICLNNPEQPAWTAIMAEQDGGPLGNISVGPALTSHEISENVAWDLVRSWFSQRSISISGKPYPNGRNNFPDYRATISGCSWDVEMSSLPNMSRRTIRASNRDLEATIRRVARQLDETEEEISAELDCRLMKKSGYPRSRSYMLVLSNWSTYDLTDDGFWIAKDVSAFDAVSLIQRNELHMIKGSERFGMSSSDYGTIDLPI